MIEGAARVSAAPKPPWKRARKRAIGWEEADQIEAKLRASDKSKDAVVRIAAEHDVSQLTITKLAGARGILVAR